MTFFLQCTTIDTGSEIPQDIPVTTTLISDFAISEEKILNIIRSLNINKAHGCDEISLRMIKLSGGALVLPLKLFLQTVCSVVSFLKYGNMQMLSRFIRKMRKI